MFNEIVVVAVSPFQRAGKEADKNGMANVYLKCIAGKTPNQAQVVAGTVAEKAGLTVGKTLLVMIDEGKTDPVYGRQFSHTVLGEVKPNEILGLQRELGKPLVIDTTTGAANANADADAAAALSLVTTTAPGEGEGELGANDGADAEAEQPAPPVVNKAAAKAGK